MDKKLLARFAVREAIGLVSMGVALFWSAGTMAWWPAWALLAVTAAWILATAVVILRRHPDLLAERLGPRQGAKRWDTMVMSLHGFAQLAIYVVGGLDKRLGWTTAFPVWAQLLALIVCALGYALIVWATASNPFFSQIVRIQTERGHSVAAGGPYATVRHPAYLGGVMTGLSLGAVSGSWWALLIGAVDALLMIVRTALEDRTLLAELPGYAMYAAQVGHRLLPGVW
jgi:protein-S-isoprenylcysteine O-methyltransferase Ste14